MPKRTVKYSSDPNDRVKNKDGTVRRFPNERFVGDVVIPQYTNYGYDYVNGRYVYHSGTRKIEAIIGPNRVKLEGLEKPVYIGYTTVIQKAY